MRRSRKLAIWAILTVVVGLAVVTYVVKDGAVPIPDKTPEFPIPDETVEPPAPDRAAEYHRGGTGAVFKAWNESSQEVRAARAARQWRGVVAMVKSFDDDFTPDQYDQAYGWLVEKAFAERDYALTLQMLDKLRTYILLPGIDTYSSLPEIDLFRAYVAGQLRRKGYLAEMLKANEGADAAERGLMDVWIRANLAWAKRDFSDVLPLTEAGELDMTTDFGQLAQPWFQHLHLRALVKLKRSEATQIALAGMTEHLTGRTAFVSVQAYRDRTILEAVEATGGDIRSHGRPYGPGFTRTDKFLCMLDDVSFDSDRDFFRRKMGELYQAFEDAHVARLSPPAEPREDFEALQRLFKDHGGNLLTPDDTVVRWKDTDAGRLFEFAHHSVLVYPRGWGQEAFEVTVFAGHVKSDADLLNAIQYQWDKSAERYVCRGIEWSIEEPKLQEVSLHGFHLGQSRADVIATETERIRRTWAGHPDQQDLRIDTMALPYNFSHSDWDNGYFNIYYEDGKLAYMTFHTRDLPSVNALELPVIKRGEFSISPSADGEER